MEKCEVRFSQCTLCIGLLSEGTLLKTKIRFLPPSPYRPPSYGDLVVLALRVLNRQVSAVGTLAPPHLVGSLHSLQWM